MSELDDSLKYELTVPREYVSQRRGSKCKYNRKNAPFFWKPYLRIGSNLNSYPICFTVAVGGPEIGFLAHPEKFNGIIWTLEVTNIQPHRRIHFSRMASKCVPKIHVENIAHEYHLRWRRYLHEPIECLTHHPMPAMYPQRVGYSKILGYYYVQENLLPQCGVRDIDVQVDQTHEFYLLFTFEGSDFAYFMIPATVPKWYGNEVLYSNIDGVFLFIPASEEREFRLKFGSVEHNERRENRFQIRVNSWDSIEIRRS